jgi:hypothetical protein
MALTECKDRMPHVASPRVFHQHPAKECLSDSERRDPGRKPENADTRDITAQWLDMGVQQPDGDDRPRDMPSLGRPRPRSESKPYSSSHPNGGLDVRVVFRSVSLVALIDQAKLYYVIQKTYTKRVELNACIYCPEWMSSRRRVRNTWHDVLATRFTVRSCPCHYRCHYRSPYLCHYHYPCPCPCSPHSLRCLDQC